jgi:hypothetical protein
MKVTVPPVTGAPPRASLTVAVNVSGSLYCWMTGDRPSPAVDRVAALSGDAALPAIETAAHAGLIHAIDAAGTRYRFATPYVSAAIRQSLNPTRRAHVRAQLAAVSAL